MLPFWLVLLTVKTVKDYSIYKRTVYFQDTHEKYRWMCGESQYIQFYDSVKKADVPVEFYRDKSVEETGYGYFVFNDTLFVCDYDSDNLYFDKDRNEWLVYYSDECLLLETEIDKVLKIVNTFLGENKCVQTVLVLPSNMLDDVPERHYERIRFLAIQNSDMVSALRNYFA